MPSAGRTPPSQGRRVRSDPSQDVPEPARTRETSRPGQTHGPFPQRGIDRGLACRQCSSAECRCGSSSRTGLRACQSRRGVERVDQNTSSHNCSQSVGRRNGSPGQDRAVACGFAGPAVMGQVWLGFASHSRRRSVQPPCGAFRRMFRRFPKKACSNAADSRSMIPPNTSGRWWQVSWANTLAP